MSKFNVVTSKEMKDVKYIEINGTWNSYVEIKGKKYRVRSEIMILNDKNEVYMQEISEAEKKKTGFDYYLPGGSLEPGISIVGQSLKEAKEETKLIIKDCRYTGVRYVFEFKEFPKQHIEKFHPYGLIYYGSITYVTAGRVDKHYSGYVKVEDRQPDMLNKGKFVPTSKLNKLHKKALKMYFESAETKDND